MKSSKKTLQHRPSATQPYHQMEVAALMNPNTDREAPNGRAKQLVNFHRGRPRIPVSTKACCKDSGWMGS